MDHRVSKLIRDIIEQNHKNNNFHKKQSIEVIACRRYVEDFISDDSAILFNDYAIEMYNLKIANNNYSFIYSEDYTTSNEVSFEIYRGFIEMNTPHKNFKERSCYPEYLTREALCIMYNFLIQDDLNQLRFTEEFFEKNNDCNSSLYNLSIALVG